MTEATEFDSRRDAEAQREMDALDSAYARTLRREENSGIHGASGGHALPEADKVGRFRRDRRQLCVSASLREYAFSMLLGFLSVTSISAQTWDTGGRLKYRFRYASYPSDSFTNLLAGSSTADHALAFRYNLGVRHEGWDVKADYQLQGVYGDTYEASQRFPKIGYLPGGLPDDDHRLFDLTHVITERDKGALLHRLDRLSVGYTADQGVVRFGRQAISWGNGLVYNPMDFFNPFDPTAIDKEYKTGDDILYGQYLQANGNDLQAVWVIRRDRFGDVTSDVDSIALKYHGFISDFEFDLQVADHFDDLIAGVGAIFNLGGGVLRGDVMVTQTDDDTVFSGVASYSYSWTWWSRNMSGLVEVYTNGFGQANGDYSPESLIRNPDLLARIGRGELFTLGREYLALSAMIEMNPLWMLTPNAFINLSDGSALVQLVSHHDIAQDWQILAALNLPIGSRGTEYGGIETGIENDGDPFYLSTDLSFTFQLAWYF